MKEKEKKKQILETNTQEIQIMELSDIGLKITIFHMSKELKDKTENFNRELKVIKKNEIKILEMKNIIIGFNSQLGTV